MMIKKGKTQMEIIELEIKNVGLKNGFQHWWFFNQGGLLIWGDHLFLNYIFLGGQWWLINPGGIVNPHLTLYHI